MDIKLKILEEYEELRGREFSEKEERKKKVYSEFPKVLEIQNKINFLGLENTKKIMRDPKNSKKYNKELKENLKLLEAEKKAFLEENKIDPEFDKIKFRCKKCSDTGYLENGERCKCFRDKLIEKSYNASNLSQTMLDMNFKNFKLSYYKGDDRENMEFILAASKKYAKNFDSMRRNILFYGDPGLGKTFLSASIAREVLDMGKSVIYISATRLFSSYEDYKFGKKEDTDDFLDALYDTDLLIIDDLGTECISRVSVSFLFDLVNERILRGKKIIINTNLLPDELERAYQKRFMSRMYEYFDVFKFKGSDIRRQKQYL